MEQVYTPKQNYKVLVRCFTYNQSKYIEDALNGFAMQKTDFPFVCLVMDDASTDGEQEVIKAWMERECDMAKAENVEIEKSFVTIVSHKTNSSCTFAFYFLKENLYKKGGKMPMVNPWREHCEYEALCEGDDYWIHPGKLQMQFDFLEGHKEYGLCCTNYLRMRGDMIETEKSRFTRDINFKQLIGGNCIGTLTTMFRIKLFVQYVSEINPSKHKWKLGDYPMWLFFAFHTKVRLIAEVTAIYRIIKGSASNPSSLDGYLGYIDSTYEIKCLFIKKYRLPYSFLKKQQIEHHYRRAGVLMKHKDIARSIKEVSAVSFNPRILLKYILKLVFNRDI